MILQNQSYHVHIVDPKGVIVRRIETIDSTRAINFIRSACRYYDGKYWIYYGIGCEGSHGAYDPIAVTVSDMRRKLEKGEEI